MVRIVALLVLAALAAMPAAALGAAPTQQQSPLQQQTPAPTQDQPGAQTTTPTPAPVTQTQADSGSLSTRDGILIAVGIVALIGGIWFVIARDAKRATAGHIRTTDSALGEGRGGSATRSARRSRRLSGAERKRRKRGRAAK